MVHDASLLNSQNYKQQIKGEWNNPCCLEQAAAGIGLHVSADKTE